jgi:fructose-bisphosphate aldolase, class II
MANHSSLLTCWISEEPDEENISICVEFFKRMTQLKNWLEMEIGVTGG